MPGACVSLENVGFDKHIYIPGVYGQPCRLTDLVDTPFRNVMINFKNAGIYRACIIACTKFQNTN